MTFKNAVTFVVTSACALLVTTSCSSTRVYYPTGRRVGHGPPPHAPAHGYRHKNVCGVELVFDTDLGLYIVVGHPDHYYYDGHFYRLVGGAWEVSLRFDSGWSHADAKPLPPGLRAKVKVADNGKSNNPGNPTVKGVAKGGGSDNGKSKSQGKAVAKGKGKHKGR